jgi:beta-glucosidase
MSPSITSFGDAVKAAQTTSQTSEEIAEILLCELTKTERLQLLDGDTPFWVGFHEMLTKGYNRRPYVHGQVDRIGLPGFRFMGTYLSLHTFRAQTKHIQTAHAA